jgi:peptide chain release factor 1
VVTLDQKLSQILTHFEELRDKLSGTIDDPAEFAKLSKEYADMTPIADKIQEWQGITQEQKNLEEMLADSSLDKDLKDMAQEDLQMINEKLPEMMRNIQILLLPKDVDDDRNAILEIRAGTGGEEAALFGAVLLRMYQRYAEVQGWKFELMHESDTGLGGIKEASAMVSGKGVFAKLKFESGVHRVQRVPETEAGGRIHTSAATVAVLPEAEEVDIQIEEKDLRIDVFRSSGPGGQSVNTTDSAVRITHIPSGVVVQQQDEKSQHKNKAKALKILRSRLYEHQRAQKAAERSASRKSQVGSGDRSERIRTYNYPQGRVTDHRINLTLYKLDKIVEGPALEEMIQALIAEDEMARLADLGETLG